MNRSSSELTALPVKSLTDPLDEIATGKLEEMLPEHVTVQRWFRSKARTISKIEVEDALAVPDTRAQLLILKIRYADGDHDLYVLPVSLAPEESLGNRLDQAIASLISETGERGALYSALTDEVFRSALLRAIICEISIHGRNGVLIASRTAALSEKCAGSALPEIDSFVSRAEQSNTSVIYRGRYILKLFRKLETGLNPDLEIGRFLTARGFKNTPAVLGTLEYRTKQRDEPYAAAILQQFVPNQGDAWSYTLDVLADFFARALSSKRNVPDLPKQHPLKLMGQEIPSELRSFIGPYLESAALLGKRTAEMHAALGDKNGGLDFAPEAFTAEDAHQLHRDLLSQADITFELLRRKQAVMPGAVAAQARELLRIEHRVSERFAAIEQHPVSALRIRHHGDYHLGQVLYTGQDFMIIDFEGEPARSLSERRAKALALRDVAGMIRSFQYAAFAALFGQVPGIPEDPKALQTVEQWAAVWNAYVSAAYLKAYFEAAGSLPFAPGDLSEARVLLDGFLLQKALYEIAYELNNRPDWLAIPMRGILGLVA